MVKFNFSFRFMLSPCSTPLKQCRICGEIIYREKSGSTEQIIHNNLRQATEEITTDSLNLHHLQGPKLIGMSYCQEQQERKTLTFLTLTMNMNCINQYSLLGCPFPRLQLCSVQVYIPTLHSSTGCVSIQSLQQRYQMASITMSLSHGEC